MSYILVGGHGMKKIIIILILIVCYFQKYEYVDLSEFKSESITVEVKGEVEKPGVYELAYQSTIKDAIDAAQGVKSGANTDTINMNQIVTHNEVIVVDQKNDQVVQVSLNAATLEQLTSIKGIGPSTAQKIIDYRNENGLFKRIEDIMNVKGIKQKLFDKIKDSLRL